jgi:hypothetical protein
MSYAWYESVPVYAVNPASSLFNAALNEIGRTYPVINRIRTWTGTSDTAVSEIARAINGPVLDRAGPRVRLVRAGANTATAVMHVPGNGPWSANVDVQAVRSFAAGSTSSAEVLRAVVPSLPASGTILVRIGANARFAANTLAHERQHADDIRHACDLAFGDWECAINGLAGTWFDTEAALDAELFRAANLTNFSADFRGDRLARLASAIYTPIGVRADYLHVVQEHNQCVIANPRWIAGDRALEFSLNEVATPSAPTPIAAARAPRHHAARHSAPRHPAPRSRAPR